MLHLHFFSSDIEVSMPKNLPIYYCTRGDLRVLGGLLFTKQQGALTMLV